MRELLRVKTYRSEMAQENFIEDVTVREAIDSIYDMFAELPKSNARPNVFSCSVFFPSAKTLILRLFHHHPIQINWRFLTPVRLANEALNQKINSATAPPGL